MKKNPKTVYKGIRMSPSLVDEVSEYQSLEHRPSFTNALETLIIIALDHLKKKNISNQSKL